MTESNTSVLDDAVFLARFEQCTLDPEDFKHQGHIRLAWLLVQRLPLAEAVGAVCAGIQRYAASLDASAKFHHTLTVACVHIIYQRWCLTPAASLEQFLCVNTDLVQDLPAVIAQYYSPQCLATAAARDAFVAPDREPLPV